MKRAPMIGILLALAITGCQPGGDSSPLIGKAAPDFTLVPDKPEGGGKPVSLSDFRGKVVLLDFWASWCQPCRQLMPYIDDLCKKHVKDLQVLAVSNETLTQIKGFDEASGFTYPMFQDPDNQAWQQYQIHNIPVSVVIDRQGKVIFYELGAFPDLMVSAVERAISSNP